MLLISAILLCLLCYASSHVQKSIDQTDHILEVYNITDTEYQALIDIYDAAAGAEWVWGTTGIPWNFTVYTNPCLDQWDGITCTAAPVDGYLHIEIIDLTSHNLFGYLPESIGDFPYLQSLVLQDNELMYGDMPETIGQLASLQILNMHESFVNGSVPSSLGNIMNLTVLDLGNCHLQGRFPSSLCSLTNLTYFDLSSNSLSDTIPACLGTWSKLQYLIIFENHLHGGIPASLGSLTDLVKVRLEINELTGSIPDELSQLTNLQEIDFSVNYLTGTIPAWIGGISGLLSLDVSANKMNGTIPHQIGLLLDIQLLYLYANEFTGTIPASFANLTLVEYLNLQVNQLSGPFPEYVGKLSQLYYLTLCQNHLTGTVPFDIGNLVAIGEINIAINLIEGTLPDTLWNASYLVAFIASNNRFTGPVPQSVFYLPAMRVVELGLNQLTGHIPEPPVFNTSLMSFLSVGYNQMSGSIPASIGNLLHLVYLNLSFNHFTRTMPEEITSLEPLNFLYLSNNLLSGALPPDWSHLPRLSYVFLNRNFFSGTIPQSVGHITRLESLNLSVNRLTGTVPNSLSKLKLLQVLLLQENVLVGSIDGVFNASHQQNLSTVQFSHNQLTGTLPDELFRVDTLKVFAAVSNCFTGSIPLVICNSSSLNTLALDGLQSATSCQNRLFPSSLSGLVSKSLYSIDHPLTGGVPSCLFKMPALTTLHLSGNGLTGSLSADLQITPTLTDLSLSHNRLSGSIPSELLNRAWRNLDLSYNRFTQSLREENGASLPHNASIFLEQNRLSGKIPGVLADVRTISVLERNLFSCNAQGSDLPSQDPDLGKYQCGSDTLNDTLYAWLVIVCVVAMLLVIAWRWRIELQSAYNVDLARAYWRVSDDVAVTLPSYREVCVATAVVVRVATTSTMWCFCVLMPIYIACTLAYGTYSHQYAWTLSAAYLSGTVPFALEFAFLLLLIVVAYVAYLLSAQNSTEMEDMRTVSVLSVSASLGRRLAVYMCYVLLTFSVVLGVNIAYVVIALNQNGKVLTLAQFVLALFKVGFNSVCSPFMMRYISHRVLRDSKSRDFVSIQLFVSLVNNILIPCLVVAIISPSCFYNVFEAPDAVKSAYDYTGKCVEFNDESRSLITCKVQQLLTATTSYDPPFEYSYQCSSSFITYYAPAYVIMCILAGFGIPVAQVTLQILHQRAVEGTRWFTLLDLVLPRIWKPLNPAVAAVPKRNVFALHFDAQQHLTTILTYLGLLLTFGAVFPPLAVCFLVALSSIVVFTRLKVGRFLYAAQTENMPGYSHILNDECEGAGHPVKLYRAVLTVLVFSFVFYTLFLFDTLGDAVGAYQAYWVIIVVPLIPSSLYCFVMCVNMYYASTQSIKMTTDCSQDQNISAGDVELKTMVETSVENPIRSGADTH